MSGVRCHELGTEELEYFYDWSDSTLEDESPYFFSITSYTFWPYEKTK